MLYIIRDVTLSDENTVARPMGMNMTPTTKNVAITWENKYKIANQLLEEHLQIRTGQVCVERRTHPGVRIGFHAGRSCCENSVSTRKQNKDY